MDPQPPTSSLPALRDINTHSLSAITATLINLRALYWPASMYAAKSQAQRQAAEQRVHDSGYASAVEEDEDDADDRKWGKGGQEQEQEEKLALLRADALERAFAVRWLTGFIARSEGWVDASAGGSRDVDEEREERENRECVAEEAVALLALSAETRADGTLWREFSFAAGEDERIVVELRDESYEEDHESVGLQTWGSACVLAERLCAAPGRYLAFDTLRTTTIRVLELGAGTGLLSMVVAKLGRVYEMGVQLDVVATDYHAAVLENLQENVVHNFSVGGCDVVRVQMLDWADAPVIVEEEDKFDVILAADVVYDMRHGAWIKSCAEKMLRHGQGRVMWLMVPMRPTRIGEVNSINTVFRGTSGLAILEVEDVPIYHSVGRADEVGYRLFRIGWVLGPLKVSTYSISQNS